jgi:isoleucyl-tRNA synthetase
LLVVRDRALSALEEARQAKAIGKALEAKLTLAGEGPVLVAANEHLDLLRELLNVSQLEIKPGAKEVLEVSVSKAAGVKCERCWHWETDVGSHPEHPTICARCVKAVQVSGRA